MTPVENRELAGYLGICWHEPLPNDDQKCICGEYRPDDVILAIHCSAQNPDFSDPRVVIYKVRELPNWQDFYRYIHSYYCREFHAWMHDEKYFIDENHEDLIGHKALEWFRRAQIGEEVEG